MSMEDVRRVGHGAISRLKKIPWLPGAECLASTHGWKNQGDDDVALVSGFGAPLVIRKVPGTTSCRLVGSAYIHSVMKGGLWNDIQGSLEDIVLVEGWVEFRGSWEGLVGDVTLPSVLSQGDETEGNWDTEPRSAIMDWRPSLRCFLPSVGNFAGCEQVALAQRAPRISWMQAP
ncbi:hypothetical protein B0T14DRAFT_519330 [Immersiella caudata]|uniref:Uncharacterized protein n=1 Tax=Immersiella caudata TaxID=314043 RepID=A0AA40BZ87_9PEZI|nr:hypothetical protein B0T14DRAFT_519330 [Immersiella caudata]